MRLSPVYSIGGREAALHQSALEHGAQPLDLDALLPGSGEWEVEIGYGKGKYLLAQSRQRPETRFLGIEVVSKYYKLLSRRAASHGVENLVNVRGEALYLLSAVLPRGFARRLHVYFPDPWPKAKHHRRRLFDPETVDLVLGVLAPGGELCFATDFIEYGELVMDLLMDHPGLTLEPVLTPWPDGARTNYEAKYIEEGRPILRCTATLDPKHAGELHPRGAVGILAATAPRPE